jgi:hypothetical protein
MEQFGDGVKEWSDEDVRHALVKVWARLFNRAKGEINCSSPH